MFVFVIYLSSLSVAKRILFVPDIMLVCYSSYTNHTAKIYIHEK